MGHRIALACLDFLDDEPEVHVAAAAEAGFDAVTLRVAGSREPVAADLGRDEHRRGRALAALRSTGLGVLDVEVLRLSTHLSLAEVSGAIELAAELGARHLLVVNAGLAPADAVDRLAAIVEEAAPAGVLPCLEPMVFTRCRTLAEAIAVAVPAGAGVLVDALHLYRSGGGVAEVAVAVATHGDALFPYLQLCDAPLAAPEGGMEALRAEALAARLLPGDGELDLTGLLAALPGRAVSVEAPTATTRAMAPLDRARAAWAAVKAVDCPQQTSTAKEAS
ncbi:AP endonuclease [Prauserella sp. PE36]|uniref:sugar phosphate isomerase/epimerase family protein n=1 Tax=Prauserella sp. PE36 TaxID=1504709 RepID=UPI000DE39F38|nr:TIM barrel protein [Prauserella sp. PE36]RBM14830.1 AP endonuclease [Prauserella sp. PE36]